MPRRNRKAGQPNREAQKNRHAARVDTLKRFKQYANERTGESNANRT